MEVVSRWGKKRFYISKIQDAINTLSGDGTACISLGAHTSIITGNGLNLAEREPCRILTGNSLTVASCLYYMDQYLNKSETAPDPPRTIAVVGASGNIGSGLIECLDDPRYEPYEIIMVGNSEKRLQKLKEKLTASHHQVVTTSDLFELRRADILICCTNTNDPIIFPHHIQEGKPVFVIDLSVPDCVCDTVRKKDTVIMCKEASSVYLRDNPDILFSTHTPKGKTFCCAAESILCGLYSLQIPLKGHIHKESVEKLKQLGLSEGLFKST